MHKVKISMKLQAIIYNFCESFIWKTFFITLKKSVKKLDDNFQLVVMVNEWSRKKFTYKTIHDILTNLTNHAQFEHKAKNFCMCSR